MIKAPSDRFADQTFEVNPDAYRKGIARRGFKSGGFVQNQVMFVAVYMAFFIIFI
jgi:hypothetical protein